MRTDGEDRQTECRRNIGLGVVGEFYKLHQQYRALMWILLHF